jgi:hypothetical protein
MAFLAANGTNVTDQMLDQWAAEANSGIIPGTPGPVIAGSPLDYPDTFWVQLDSSRFSKIDQIAQAQHRSPAEVLNDLVDAAAA